MDQEIILNFENYDDLILHKDHTLVIRVGEEGDAYIHCTDCEFNLVEVFEKPVDPEALHYVNLNDVVHGLYKGNDLLISSDVEDDPGWAAIEKEVGSNLPIYFDIYLDDVSELPKTLREAEALFRREIFITRSF